MGRPKYCKKCKRGDQGDGMLRESGRWDDRYLRETNRNAQKYGRIERIDLCERCIREIKKNRHIVRKDGKKQ